MTTKYVNLLVNMNDDSFMARLSGLECKWSMQGAWKRPPTPAELARFERTLSTVLRHAVNEYFRDGIGIIED